MKKIILYTACLSFFTGSLFAQQDYNIKKARFGINAGLAFSKIVNKYTSPFPGTNKKTGEYVGVFGRFLVQKKIVFQPGISIVGKGYQMDYQDIYTRPVTIYYLEIPLNIIFRPKPTKYGFYFVGGGFSPAYNLDKLTLFKYGSLMDYRSNIKAFDLGVNVIAGYQLPIGFSLNVGYTYGLINLNKQWETQGEIHNRYWSIYAGYEF